MECARCKREDCGTCTNCKDMVKFGGPGRKKQKCALRVCLLQQSDSKGIHVRTTYNQLTVHIILPMQMYSGSVENDDNETAETKKVKTLLYLIYNHI